MNNTLFENLEPIAVWKYFGEILQIPRPSKSEEKILAYIEQFAINNNLEHKKDTIGNIVIKKPASPGRENQNVVVLQSHVDMVCEKNSNVEHNFLTDPIKAVIDGNWIKADGTTLGADNGIGVAAQLAVLADKTLKHGPIECLFTVDEETGLTGAKQMTAGFISGKVLLNLDSEDEGELFIGCAGGIDTTIQYPYIAVEPDRSLIAIKININGLLGGHSGDDINKGRANAIKLMARFLWDCINNFDIFLASFQGGNLRNAIPREAESVILLHPAKLEAFKKYYRLYKSIIKNENKYSDKDIEIEFCEVDKPGSCLDKNDTRKLVGSLYACPNGVIAMSQAIEALVETSTNLASVHFKDNSTIEIVTSQRSSTESAKYDIANRVACIFQLTGAKTKHGEGYPGWAPDAGSKVLKTAQDVYSRLFNTTPKVKAIHAGLECGLFLENNPGLDMVSFGPTLRNVHSPDERMEIESVEKFWKFLIALLENIG
ncbi:MAG: aminoacyl-histidine dipeptidase [Bacteroidales bacterium]|nr:aminoacyl-histidine dipeptidase [Bacteroidales bacterium]